MRKKFAARRSQDLRKRGRNVLYHATDTTDGEVLQAPFLSSLRAGSGKPRSYFPVFKEPYVALSGKTELSFTIQHK